jgi:hypothetical protein
MNLNCIIKRDRMLLLAATVAAILLSVSLQGHAQARPAGTTLPDPSRVDMFGGYSYFHPVDSDIYNVPYQPIGAGAVVDVTAYFNRHLGVEVEEAFFPHGPNDCVYSAHGGLVYRGQLGRLFPFTHILAGGTKVGGPTIQPCTWGYGFTAGLGVDYVLPSAAFHNRVALRPLQADFTYSHVDYGPQTGPNSLGGGLGQIWAYRLSTGLVIRLGDVSPPPPAQYGCEVSPVSAYPGDLIKVNGRSINLDDNKKLTPVYTWGVTAGKITGTTDTATIDTAGVAPGDYMITGHVREGLKGTQHADCTASYRILPYQAPTIDCSANPTTILVGETSTITATGRSPQNRPINYSYGASAGQIVGTGATGTLSTANVSPGVIAVTCNVVDDLGKSANATVSVTVNAPPPPPAPPVPQTRTLCSISFDRDRKRPVRVDNEAKGCLDDIALEMNREIDSTLVVVGKHDPQETPEAAAERTLNIKQYLTIEKGIDPLRIVVRTGESTGRSADDILVPAGATWDPGQTSSFDPSRVVRHGQPYGTTRVR